MRHPVTVGDVEGGLLPLLVLVDGLGVGGGFGWSVATGGVPWWWFAVAGGPDQLRN